MRPLGKRQKETLRWIEEQGADGLGCSPDPVLWSLVKRGLVRRSLGSHARSLRPVFGVYTRYYRWWLTTKGSGALMDLRAAERREAGS